MRNKNTKVVEQETEKMLDVLATMWPGQEEYMKHVMATKLAEHYGDRWRDKKHCLNCKALMHQYTYTVNKTAARALMKYADAVGEEQSKGKTFTEANKLYLSGMHDRLTATETDQKTILRYHGLIAKVKVEGKHKDSLWAITRRGWAFLRGEPVQSSVTVWRGDIIERGDNVLVTIGEVLAEDASEWDGNHYAFAPHDGALI